MGGKERAELWVCPPAGSRVRGCEPGEVHTQVGTFSGYHAGVLVSPGEKAGGQREAVS